MKTPKELNKIYDRFPKDKTELATHKVELAGLADRAEKFTEDLTKSSRDFMTDYMAVISETIKKGQKEDSFSKGTTCLLSILQGYIQGDHRGDTS